VLFLDEPTTGLDPEARAAMWVEVARLADEASLTILLTTHYLEEADQLAERVAIVSRGKVVAQGTPAALKADLRGELVTIDLAEAESNGGSALSVLHAIEGASELAAEGRQLRARVPNGAEAIPVILAALDEQGFPVTSVSTQRPSLDDVYLHYTGRDFSTEDQEAKR
jgi:ABC-2 type transport system ATP-binding protein